MCSLSEPSLLTPADSELLEGSSGPRRSSVWQRRGPPPPSSLARASAPPPPPPHRRRPSEPLRSCSRPAFIHFSQALRPDPRPRPARRHSHDPAPSLEAERGQPWRRAPPQGAPLSVVGKPCPLSCSRRPAVALGPARAQLHVFLPSEAQGEEADCESVDEGFMDELDVRVSSLKLQQRAPHAATRPA
ncbi:uncharacterized protein ACNS7B_013789 [Menidia menidia]